MAGLTALFRAPGSPDEKIAWNSTGALLVVAGRDGNLSIIDRHGSAINEQYSGVPGASLIPVWEKGGERVIIAYAGSSQIVLLDATSNTLSYLDLGPHVPSFVGWPLSSADEFIVGCEDGTVLACSCTSLAVSHTSPTAVGKGALVGAVLPKGAVVVGSADGTLAVLSATCEVVAQFRLQRAAASLHAVPLDDAAGTSLIVADTGNGELAVLRHAKSSLSPHALVTLDDTCGTATCVALLPGGRLLCGTSEGYLASAVLPAPSSAASQSPQQQRITPLAGRLFDGPVTAIEHCTQAGRVAVASGSLVRLLDLRSASPDALPGELPDELAVLDPADGIMQALSWSPDGGVLVATSTSGAMLGYVGHVTPVGRAHGRHIVQVTAPNEAALLELGTDGVPVLVARCALGGEPDAVALTNTHVVVASHSAVTYIPLTGGGAQESVTCDFMGSLDALVADEGVVGVLTGGRLAVHTVPSTSALQRQTQLPVSAGEGAVTCAGASQGILYYGTSKGGIGLFNTRDWLPIPCGLQPSPSPIVHIAPNSSGTRAIVISDNGAVLLCNPVDGTTLTVAPVPAGASIVLWDSDDSHVFVVCSSTDAAAFTYCPLHLSGAMVQPLGTMDIRENGDVVVGAVTTMLAPRPGDLLPLALFGGTLLSAAAGPLPRLHATVLVTHSHLALPLSPTADSTRAAFAQHLSLQHFDAAWTLAHSLDERALWLALSGKALELLEFPIAERAYHHLGDAAMAAAVRQLESCDDCAAAAGRVAVLFGDYELAQQRFLESGYPLAALQLLRDLRRWDAAVALADTLAPREVPELLLQAGLRFEAENNAAEALARFDSGLRRAAAAGVDDDSNLLASLTAGLARSCLRAGDLQRGFAIATAADADPSLQCECAEILEVQGQFAVAGDLLARVGAWNRAATLLLAGGDYPAAVGLADNITSLSVLRSFARSAEAAGDFEASVAMFQRAGNEDEAVRVLCQRVGDLERAAGVARGSGSGEAMRQVGRAYRLRGDVRSAVGLYLQGGARDDAFAAAAEHDAMETYVEALRRLIRGGDLTEDLCPTGEGFLADAAAALPPDECDRICRHFESRGQLVLAADVLAAKGLIGRAAELYVEAGTPGSYAAAIALAVRSRDDSVIKLLERCFTELDGESERSSAQATTTARPTSGTALPAANVGTGLLLQLYIAIGEYKAAGRAALAHASGLQQSGDYLAAHSSLFTAARAIFAAGGKPPRDLYASLALVHSHLLIPRLEGRGDVAGAAALAVRVARAVDRFPRNTVPILTSAVLITHKAGMKRTAHEFACVLMEPQYRGFIDDAVVRTIENIVRRPSSEESDAPSSLCPFCIAPLATSALQCHHCERDVPFCIATGQHMTQAGCASCPRCSFPALQAPFAAQLADPSTPAADGESDKTRGADRVHSSCCPMCGEAVSADEVRLVPDPVAFLGRWMA